MESFQIELMERYTCCAEYVRLVEGLLSDRRHRDERAVGQLRVWENGGTEMQTKPEGQTAQAQYPVGGICDTRLGIRLRKQL